MIFQIVRGAAAMIVGYGAIVGLTSLGFNGVLGGRTLYGGPSLILGAGMLVAVIAGLLGGYIAGFIGPGPRLTQCFSGRGSADWRYDLCLALFQAKHRANLVRCYRRGDSHDSYRRRGILEGTN